MKKLALAAASLALTAVTASAQSAPINATATVLQPLSVAGAQNLAFGNVFPGLNKAVAYTDAANAGKFTVSGEQAKQVSMTFTLPANLTSGANNLLIDTWTGYYNTTNSSASGGAAFTPSTSAQLATLSAAGNPGQLFLFVGGTVKPTATQVAGTYTGTVQLNVVYTGL